MDDQILAEVKHIARNESIWHFLSVFSLVINVLIVAGLCATEWKTEVRLRSLEAQLQDYQSDKWRVKVALENSKIALNRTDKEQSKAR
jgi:hypothetical protein